MSLFDNLELCVCVCVCVSKQIKRILKKIRGMEIMNIRDMSLFKERGEISDIPWRGVRGAGYPEASPMQGSNLRYSLMEGQARARHG